jgi:hypothetical protein
MRDKIQAAGIAPALVVIDTQSLASRADENSNTEMNEVFSNLKWLADKLDSAVFTIHHTGWEGTRGRGASVQWAALDCQIQVQEHALTITKVKAYKPSPALPFVLEPADGLDTVWARPSLDERARVFAATDAPRTVAQIAQAILNLPAGAQPTKVDTARIRRHLEWFVDNELLWKDEGEARRGAVRSGATYSRIDADPGY